MIEQGHEEIYREMRYLGASLNTIGDLGRYASILWGLSAILKDKPRIDEAIFAGITFGLASFVKYMSLLAATKSERIEMERKISELEKKINN